MSENASSPSRRRRGGRRSPASSGGLDALWRPVPAPEPAPRIEPVAAPVAFITSLGAPPLRGGYHTQHYITAAVERSAALAIALAASADLLEHQDVVTHTQH